MDNSTPADITNRNSTTVTQRLLECAHIQARAGSMSPAVAEVTDEIRNNRVGKM
jgi:hypothetical protein